MQIYVASLSDYNDGRLHGVHIDLPADKDEVWAQINKMLKESPTMKDPFYAKHGMVAEEFAIHDYEGFHSYTIHEYESIDRVIKAADFISQYGVAGAAWLENDSTNIDSDDLEEAFSESYRQWAKDEHDYAFEHIQAIGEYKGIPWSVFDENYNMFDWDYIAQELMQDCYTVADDSEGIHVFSMV